MHDAIFLGKVFMYFNNYKISRYLMVFFVDLFIQPDEEKLCVNIIEDDKFPTLGGKYLKRFIIYTCMLT